MKRILLSLIICHLSFSVSAKVTLPAFFSDGMVLQQQSECNVWGWAEPGKWVVVGTSWDKKTHNVMANKDGLFSLKVKTPAAGGPYFIGFKDSDYVQVSNVMIGEVWICSGQSNMEMQMKGYKAQPVEGATAELLHCQDPELRMFTVKRLASLTPKDDVEGQWNEANATNVREFSATAYYFGRALRQMLGVPVGLIVTAYGGSACEAWMRPDWLKDVKHQTSAPAPLACYQRDARNIKLQTSITEDDVKRLQQRCPTALYNGQLHPLVGYSLRGAIWYQGEDNVPRYDYYAPLMARMIQGWREEWKQGDFPFYYCQIAPFDYSVIDWAKYNSALLREQQAKVETTVANCRMAVLMDTGIKDVIHPRKKRQAGERLALLALSNTYGVKGLPEYAVYSSVEFRGDTAVVAFDRSKEWVYFENGSHSSNFEIAGDDRVFHPAEAWVNRNRVYVRSAEVKVPVAVRYAFKDWVVGDLMHDGLPVSSFRTDNW